MGTKLKDLFTGKAISLDILEGKRIVIDGANTLYQFLTTIRGPDGSMLTDSHGRVTSHLVGLFSRCTRLLQMGVALAMVFDGKPPALKQSVLEQRAAAKAEAARAYAAAKEAEDITAMRKYAARTVRLTPDMVEEAKALLEALGIPVIMAPAEGEAQAAHIVRNGHAYAVVSQDFDCLLFGASCLIRNLAVGERHRTSAGQPIVPELIELRLALSNLGITQEQLIVLGMLVGTDYCPGGIRGIGPKHALELVQKHGNAFEPLFAEVQWKEKTGLAWKDVFQAFAYATVSDKYNLEGKAPDTAAVLQLLCTGHQFAEERVRTTLEKLRQEKRSQVALHNFF